MRFIYLIDPMCSWCWAFSSTIDELKQSYPNIGWQYLMGGLAPDSDHPMDLDLQQKIQEIWRDIEKRTGTAFNHDFWEKNTPRRSTYPACKAVIAAESLQNGSAEKMIKAIQHAYYLKALNPSDNEILVDLAVEIGLDKDIFLQTLNSSEVDNML